jgi:hypothetical protein
METTEEELGPITECVSAQGCVRFECVSVGVGVFAPFARTCDIYKWVGQRCLRRVPCIRAPVLKHHGLSPSQPLPPSRSTTRLDANKE